MKLIKIEVMCSIFDSMQGTAFLLDGGPLRSIRIDFNATQLIHAMNPDTTLLKSTLHDAVTRSGP